MAIRLGVQIIKIEISLGEFYVSWKRILWKSDYDEMFSFISRYLNSFIPFFQLTKHLNPWPHYKAIKALLILNLCATSWKWGEKKRVEKFEEWESIHPLEFYKRPEKDLENFL